MHSAPAVGKESGSEAKLSNSLREAGQDPERVLELAERDDAMTTLSVETEAAEPMARLLDDAGNASVVANALEENGRRLAMER